MELTKLIDDESDVIDIETRALVAAIDVGSNALRMGIATYDAEGNTQVIQRYRVPVRLGHDAFTTGALSAQSMDDALEAFREFRRLLDQHHIETYRAHATSAMRSSRNGLELVQRIFDETGIVLTLIGGEEEARLVQYSISKRMDLSNKHALLMDMGGGSVEVSFCKDAKVLFSQSFKVGTVRLIEMMNQNVDFKVNFTSKIQYLRQSVSRNLGKLDVDVCVATGGNATAIGALAVEQGITDDKDQISRKQLGQVIKLLESMSFEDRMTQLGLRPDRADVILPAAMVFREIMKVAGCKAMEMPDAGLLDGILFDMLDSEEDMLRSRYDNLMAMSRNLGKKFHIDRHFGECVAKLASSMFDQLKPLHDLKKEDRTLLEIAGKLHEMGMYINTHRHHHHAAYLISEVPLFGISEKDRAVLAQIFRYQRKSAPNDDHTKFSALNKAEKQKVWHLSAILRLAIALNKERRERVKKVMLTFDDKTLNLRLEGSADMLLERWAVLKVTDYVQQAFGLTLKGDVEGDDRA